MTKTTLPAAKSTDATRLGIHALLPTDSAAELTRRCSDVSDDSAAIAVATASRARKRVRRASTAAATEQDARTSSEDGAEEDETANIVSTSGNDIFQLPSEASAPLTPKSHQVRRLRAEAAALETQLEALRHKWRTEIADPALLPLACAAAKQRSITAKYELEQQQLRDHVLLQQLFLATLQCAATKSPLLQPLNSLDVFDAVHDPIHLEAADREYEMKRLQTRSCVALRLAPTIAERFMGDLARRTSLLLPCTATSVSADHAFTYVATATATKIERTSVERVFDGVLHYFRSLDRELGHHYDVSHSIHHVHQLGPMSNYAQLRYWSGSASFASVSTTVFAATLTADAGTIVIDFVDSDELFPEVRRDTSCSSRMRQRRDACVVLSITSDVDAVTRRKCVLVRHLRLHRFNVRPNSATMVNELRVMQAYTNGDLFLSVLCRFLQQQNNTATRITTRPQAIETTTP